MEDKWIHRSKGMRCRTCMYFVRKVPEALIEDGNNIIGRCRRHAPTVNGYPVVYSIEWCGDHKIDENKEDNI